MWNCQEFHYYLLITVEVDARNLFIHWHISKVIKIWATDLLNGQIMCTNWGICYWCCLSATMFEQQFHYMDFESRGRVRESGQYSHTHIHTHAHSDTYRGMCVCVCWGTCMLFWRCTFANKHFRCYCRCCRCCFGLFFCVCQLWEKWHIFSVFLFFFFVVGWLLKIVNQKTN